jgi:hypothetical protein
MLKKIEVLKELENGGAIMVDSVYRTAHVLNAAGERLDTCRYDVAENLGRAAGYKKTFSRGWALCWYIEKETAPAAETEAAEEKTAEEWAEESARVESAVSESLAAVIAAEADQEEAAPEYLKLTAPASNEENGVYYQLTYKKRPAVESWPEETQTLYTVDAVESAVHQINYNGGQITAAQRVTVNADSFETFNFIPETRQDRTDRENRDYCRRIAEDLERYAAGTVYKCPECGEIIEFDDLDELEIETEDYPAWAYKLPCGCETTDEPEQLTLYDFFADCLDIEYRCSSRKEYNSVSIMVTCGGPNIYIDTEEKAVLLYWWSDRARYYLSSDAVEAVDEWAAEYWNCI